MDRGGLALTVGELPLPRRDIPDDLVDLIVLQLVKDAVGANEDVI